MPDGSAAFEALRQQVLEPCAREDAARATVIRRCSKADRGQWPAASVLHCYTEVRFKQEWRRNRDVMNGKGVTVRCKAVAAQWLERVAEYWCCLALHLLWMR